MKRRYLILTALATLIIGCSVSAAIRHRRAHHAFNDRLIMRLTRQLDLSDTQQAQVRSILQAERSRVEPLFIAAAENRRELNAATDSGKFDEAQVRSLAAQQAETIAQLIVEKQRAKARIYNEVLTAQQRDRAEPVLVRFTQPWIIDSATAPKAIAPVGP